MDGEVKGLQATAASAQANLEASVKEVEGLRLKLEASGKEVEGLRLKLEASGKEAETLRGKLKEAEGFKPQVQTLEGKV